MLRLKAYAKINLSLKLLGLRPDGYHEIESEMQSVSLCDYITLSHSVSGIEVACDNPLVPRGKENIAYRAAELFIDAGSRVKGVKIAIEKHIPLAAGLAGGSADAAAVLFGLNKLTGNTLSEEELLKLGAQVGSDVPFCLIGGNCFIKGRGEQVIRNPKQQKKSYVLVTPGIEVSTKWAYETWDKKKTKKCGNDLEPIIEEKYPVIKIIRERLLGLGCSNAQMSGSGSSVFGEVGSEIEGQKIAIEMGQAFPMSCLVQTMEHGVEESGIIT